MTDITLPDPTDSERFHEGLTTYLQAARRNQVAIERAWHCEPDSGQGWEIEIVPVVSRPTPEQN